MSIIDLACNLSDAVEPTILPADEEASLRIVSCVSKMNKNDEPYLLPRFEVVDEPTAKEFTKYFPVPFTGQDAKDQNNAMLGLQRFFSAFDYDGGGQIDTESLVGLTGWAILGVENDEKYGESNYVKRFIAAK